MFLKFLIFVDWNFFHSCSSLYHFELINKVIVKREKMKFISIVFLCKLFVLYSKMAHIIVHIEANAKNTMME